MNQHDYLTVAEAAEHLRASPATVRRMIDRGDLVAYRLKGSPLLRISRRELEASLEPVARS